jgi:hypothetical protein
MMSLLLTIAETSPVPLPLLTASLPRGRPFVARQLLAIQ